jgi:hypothetical protein
MPWVAATLLLTLGLSGVSSAQDQSVPYYNAATGLYNQKKYDQAIQYYQAAAQVNPSMWQAYQGVGNAYYAKGEKDKALANYQRALDINPNNPPLASFVQSLRAQMKAESAPAPKGYSAAEREKILQTASGVKEEHFELNPAVGIAVGNGAEGLGIGGGASGFYFVDSNWGFGGILRFYGFGYSSTSSSTYETQSFTYGTYTSTDNESDGSLEILAAFKYKFDGQGLVPYITGGLGFTDVMVSSTTKYNYENGAPLFGTNPTSSFSNSGFFPILDAGGGLEFSAGDEMSIFVEGRLDFILGNGSTASYIPLEGGLSFIL